MADMIDRLKAHARILHREAAAGKTTSLNRMRRLAEFKTKSDADLVSSVRRRHCLTVLANELGFTSWPDVVRALDGEPSADFGTLLYPAEVWAHWNIWCASYDEAKTIRAEHGGYLLIYKHQYLVVDADYIDAMGLSRDDPDWSLIGRDWACPAQLKARQRLCEKLVHLRLAGLEFGP